MPKGEKMTPKEAQTIVERLVNLHSDNITLCEIKQALVVLANFYEDYKGYVEIEDENSRKAEKCL